MLLAAPGEARARRALAKEPGCLGGCEMIDRGITVIAWDRNSDHVRALKDRGAERATAPSEGSPARRLLGRRWRGGF